MTVLDFFDRMNLSCVSVLESRIDHRKVIADCSIIYVGILDNFRKPGKSRDRFTNTVVIKSVSELINLISSEEVTVCNF